MKKIVKDALVLFAITLVAGILLGVVYQITLDPIAKANENAKEKAYKAVLAEHSATSQRLIVLDSGKKKLLTPKDIKGEGVEEKLENLSQKFKYQNSNISDIQITKRGTMYAYGREKRFPLI